MRKKKILIIMSKMVGGGAERVLVNLLEGIDKSVFEIDLFIGLEGGALERQIPSHINVQFIFPHRIFEISASFFLRYLNSTLIHRIFGRNIHENYDFGLCFLDSYYSYFLNHSGGKIKRRGVVIHSSLKTYSFDFKKYKPEPIKRKKAFYKNLDKIIFVSNDSMIEFSELYGNFGNERVIYNPINIDRVKELAQKATDKLFQDYVLKIIAVGSHKAVKNYKNLIKACEILVLQGLDFHLQILGDGELYEEHKDLIEKSNLVNHITLRGFIENPYPYIKQADVFIMPSIAEGLPTAMCESMILETPIITTNVPGCREVVNNGEYGMITNTDPESLAKTIEEIIRHPEILDLYKEKAKERGLDFRDDIAISNYEKFLNED